MNFTPIIFILFVIILKINAEKYVASDFAVPKNCSETQTIRTQKYVPYEEIFESNVARVGKAKTRTKYRYETVELNQTKAICCDGYQNYNESQCIPICTKSCGSEGICFSPDNCICNDGYSLDSNSKKCEPICSSQCINGFCMSPDICSCHEGYRMTNDNHTCEPICQNGTETCTKLEFCAEPGVCRCKQGYARNSLDRQLRTEVLELCKPICDRTCINGECILPNTCQCHENYTRVDEFTCERVHVAANFVSRKNCSETKIIKRKTEIPYEETYLQKAATYNYDYNWGSYRTSPAVYNTRTKYRIEYTTVNETKAICCDGYQNYDEENCLPVCSKSCGSHGICSAPDVCICDEGYSMDNLGNCEPACQSECKNGRCTSPNYCTCDEGYRKLLDDYFCEPIFFVDLNTHINSDEDSDYQEDNNYY